MSKLGYVVNEVVDYLDKNCPTFFSDHYFENANDEPNVRSQFKKALSNCHNKLLDLYGTLIHELSHAAVDVGTLKGSRTYSTPPEKDTDEYKKWVQKYKEDPAEIDAYANQYVAAYILNKIQVNPRDITNLMSWAVKSYALTKDSKEYKKFAKAVYKAFQSHFKLTQ